MPRRILGKLLLLLILKVFLINNINFCEKHGRLTYSHVSLNRELLNNKNKIASMHVFYIHLIVSIFLEIKFTLLVYFKYFLVNKNIEIFSCSLKML